MSEGGVQTERVEPKKRIGFPDFARGTVEAASDFLEAYIRTREIKDMTGYLLSSGVRAAYPERLEQRTFFQDSGFRLFSRLSSLGDSMNGYVDMVPFYEERRREGNPSAQKEIDGKLSVWRYEFKQAMVEAKSCPERKLSEWRVRLLKTYHQETLFAERTKRENPDISSQKFQEMVNAISIFHTTCALFGPEFLPERLNEIGQKDLTWEMLEGKYDWLINGDPKGEDETKLCGLFYAVMIAQLVDDAWDYKRDAELGDQTMALDLLAKQKNKRRVYYEGLAQEYIKKAETFGMTKAAARGMQYFSRLVKIAHRLGIGRGTKEKPLWPKQ